MGKIEECTETDLGKYKLVAKNEKGEASSKAVEVKMEGKKPAFKKKLLGLNIEEGQAIDIECEISSPDINSTVEWTRNSVVVRASESVIMTFDGKVAHLHIEKATIEHAGEYMCVVKNQFGECDTVSKVEIKEEEQEEEQVEEKQEEIVEKKRKESLKVEEKVEEKKVSAKKVVKKSEKKEEKIMSVDMQSVEAQDMVEQSVEQSMGAAATVE